MVGPALSCRPSSASDWRDREFSGSAKLAVFRKKSSEDGAMIRSDAPFGQCEHIGALALPFTGHPTAQQDVVDAAVSVVLRKIVSPGDVARRNACADRIRDVA